MAGGWFAENAPPGTDPSFWNPWAPKLQPDGTYKTPDPNDPLFGNVGGGGATTQPEGPGFTDQPDNTNPATFNPGVLNPQGPQAQTSSSGSNAQSIIAQWQQSHSVTSPDIPGLVKALNAAGIQATQATHAGGTQLSDDKIKIGAGDQFEMFDLGSSLGSPGGSWFNNPSAMAGEGITPGGGYSGGGFSLGSFGDLTAPFTGSFQGMGQVPYFNAGAYGSPQSFNQTFDAGAYGAPMPFTQQFDPNAYGAVPSFTDKFVAPTGLTMENDPGYKARLKMGTDALQSSAAARGTLLTGGTQKDLIQFGQDYGSNEFGNVYNRALSEFGTKLSGFGANLGAQNQSYNQGLGGYNAALQGYGANLGGQNQGFNQGLLGYNANLAGFGANLGAQAQSFGQGLSGYGANLGAQNQNYNQSLGTFGLNYDIFRNNQNDPYNKLYGLTQLGANSAANYASGLR